MAKYLYVYHGGSVPQSKEEGERVMQAWMGWFGQLGAAVVDGGNPVGTVDDGQERLGHRQWRRQPGERLFDHRSRRARDDAVAKAKGCPITAAAAASVGSRPIIEMI